MTTIADRDIGRVNNFNLLRMLAAIAVLVSHAWPLALGTGTGEPLQDITGYKLGSTAVSIFFAVSGYFITKSFARRKSLPDFVLARVARIFPALLLVLVLTVTLLGPLLTDLTLRDYLTDRHSWTYLPHNLLLRHPQWTLPGVFIRNPGGPAINGSLWTLFYEVACYAAVMALGVIGLLRPVGAVVVAVIAAIMTLIVPQQELGSPMALTAILFLPFTLGGAVYACRAYVPLSPWIVGGLAVVLAMVGRSSPLYPLCHAVLLSYGALWFGFSLRWLRGYSRLGDYSYGVYIYAFPIEQFTVRALTGASPALVIAAALPVTLILAAASWHLVEHPALAHRHVLRRWRTRAVSVP